MRWLHRLAELWHDELHAGARRELEEYFGRLVPRVHRQAESAPVDRQERSPAQQGERLQRILRPEMHVSPGWMQPAHLQHDEVERPKPLANNLVLGGKAGVAAQEHRVAGRAYDER